MASLQEQLLKAGLANKSTAKQARTDKRKKQKLKNKGADVAQDEHKVAAQQAVEAKKQRDRELNQQRQAELEKKAVVAQIRQLITVNQQPKGNGDTVLNFTDNNVVKRMYVSDAVHKLVIDARLAVVKLDDDYALLPTPVADKIAERDASVVIYRADLREENKEKSAEDDWYADYQIPDDLTW